MSAQNRTTTFTRPHYYPHLSIESFNMKSSYVSAKTDHHVNTNAPYPPRTPPTPHTPTHMPCQFIESFNMKSFYVSAKTGDNVNTCFHKVAADLAGIALTKPEVEVAAKVLIYMYMYIYVYRMYYKYVYMCTCICICICIYDWMYTYKCAELHTYL